MFFHVLSLLLTLSALSLSAATSCPANQFHWAEKDCCLPTGGKSAPSSPPAGKSCPTSMYFHSGYGCCVPYQPTTPTPPSGSKCENGWPWSSDELCCKEPPPPSKPSGKPHWHTKKKRQAQVVMSCPAGLKACAIGDGLTGEWECIDPMLDLTACGGCVGRKGRGKDCTAIEGADGVGCEAGACAIYSCLSGYALSLDGKTCQGL